LKESFQVSVYFFMNKGNLKIAVQKSGRLSESTIQLLKKCDIGFDNGHGKLKSAAFNFPLEILFLRDDDIPGYIEDGVADCGIVGQNVLTELGSD
jgi:ATP phosphoribosyltransferase